MAVEIQEQVSNDAEVSGLTLTFWRTPSGEGRLWITGGCCSPNRTVEQARCMAGLPRLVKGYFMQTGPAASRIPGDCN